MSLDTEKLHRLKAKKFDALYARDSEKWKEMVESATEYVRSYLDGTGDKVRPADIAAILRNALKVDPQFEAYLENKKLHQKYWAEWFADFLVEQVYPSPEIK